MPLTKDKQHTGDCDTQGTVNKDLFKASTRWRTALKPNPNRVGITVWNVSDAEIEIDYGKDVKHGAMLRLYPGDYWESPYACGDEFQVKASDMNAVVSIREF